MLEALIIDATTPAGAAVNDTVAATATLASSEGSSTDTMLSLTVMLVVALVAPVLSYMVRKRIPAVVFLIFGGMLIGPSIWGFAEVDAGVATVRELGLGMLFLLAGMELDVASLRSKEGRNAQITWLLSLLAALAGAGLFVHSAGFLTWVTLAIAVSSTALGTLVPILKQDGTLSTPIGKSVMIHGAIGELFPILAIALLLSTRSTWMTVLILIAFFAIALVVIFVPRTVAMVVPWVGKAIIEGASATNQTIVRMVLLMLATLMTVAAVFQLDVVLGAFAAGILLRQVMPHQALEILEERLNVVGYGFFIPVFFVCSGMGIDIDAVKENLGLLAAVVGVIALARGVPVFVRESLGHTGSQLKTRRERIQLSLYAATGLPIIVAVTEVAVHADLIHENTASVLVAGGAVTVLFFPMIAGLLGSTGRKKSGSSGAARRTPSAVRPADRRFTQAPNMPKN